MRYASYSSLDFAQDPGFIRWVRTPDAANVAFWQDFLDQHPEQQAAVVEARHLLTSLRFRTYVPETDRQLATKARIDVAYARREYPLTQGERTVAGSYWRGRVAASLAAVLLLVAGYWFYQRTRPVSYQTGYGQIQRVTLPDSSVVVLNANSTLTLGTDWLTTREVVLDGEAYFSVTHTAAHIPFIVKASNGFEVEVLGTEFDVVSRPQRAHVVLDRGQIRLRQQGSQAVLVTPGEMVDLAGQLPTKRRVQPGQYSSWRTSKLVFDNTSLAEIALLLKDTYGYTVTFGDESLKTRRFRGILPTNNPQILFKALETYFQLQISQSGTRVLIIQPLQPS